jgi:hypothetical protein
MDSHAEYISPFRGLALAVDNQRTYSGLAAVNPSSVPCAVLADFGGGSGAQIHFIQSMFFCG